MGLIEQVRAGRRLPPPDMARAIRIAAGVTQQQLADEIPAHVTTVARWENATRRPRGAMRARYGELLEQLRAEVE